MAGPALTFFMTLAAHQPPAPPRDCEGRRRTTLRVMQPLPAFPWQWCPRQCSSAIPQAAATAVAAATVAPGSKPSRLSSCS